MIKQMYAMFDSAAKCYYTPFAFNQEAEAVRLFRTTLTNDGPIRDHYADYHLFCLGEFDDSNGVLTGFSEPRRIVSGHELHETLPLKPNGAIQFDEDSSQVEHIGT